MDVDLNQNVKNIAFSKMFLAAKTCIHEKYNMQQSSTNKNTLFEKIGLNYG